MSTELTLLPRVSFRGQEITAPRLRGLLALLAGDLRTGASTARLVSGLWPDEKPENPTKALQVVVTRARATLGPDVIASTPTGYRLVLAEEQIDAAALVLRAASSAQRARTGDHAAALAEAEAGLSLWEGAPTGDEEPGDDPAAALRARRLPVYRSLARERALALARLGRRAEALDALAEVSREHHRDEEVLLELLRCESATVGPSAALDRYEGYRRTLRDELGTDPGPALRSLHGELLAGAAPTVRGGVLHEPNQLLGRADDIDAVLELLRTSRVASIVGPGGLGKTRLAHAVSRAATQPVVQLVPLAGVGSDADVATEVASALGVGDARRSPIAAHQPTPGDTVAGIVAALGPGPALLVLDNCEHVIGGAAKLVQQMVAATRDLRIVTTSRAPLDLTSESVYLLPELDEATAVELFSQRARSARPGVDLPAAMVAEVVRHLDGLPLAVELAAAKVRVMSVAEIAERITDRFALLRGGPRDAPERHRTLTAVVEWSWTLLDPAARSAMRELSVFPDGFTAAAAHALLGGDTLPVLARLIDQSLLRTTETLSGTRYRMLETVREFAAARRDEEETERATVGFLAWARDFGVRHHDAMFGPDPFSIVDSLRAEQDNLVHAVRLALGRGDGATVAAGCAVLSSLWVLESNFSRLARLADDTAWLLSHYRPEPELVEATRAALALAATYAFMLQGPRPVRSLVALRRLPAGAPNTLVRASATILLAAVRDPAVLFALCESDDPVVAGAANGVAGYLWETEGELERAVESARRMLDGFRGGAMPWPEIMAKARIAELCLQLERGAEAMAQLTEVLPVCQRLGTWGDVTGLQWWMVLASLQLGAVDEAEGWLAQTTADRSGDPSAYTYGLAVQAEILLARGQVDAGLELWRQAAEAVVAAMRDPVVRRFESDLDPWTLEAWAVTVVAHARHGRLDQVAGVAAQLPGQLTAILTHPAPNPPPYLLEFSVCGTILLALSTMDLAADPPPDPDRATIAARMTALAERFRYLRAFQPTMSSAVARQAAQEADEAAHREAVSRYAAMDRPALRAAALDLVAQRMGSRA